jgi:hypothetical protein
METSTTTFQPPSIPKDSEGFVKSFTLSSYDCPEAQEARAFFEQFGFVVFANVFTPEQCATTISDIWDVIESFVQTPIRNDEKLWTPQYVFVISVKNLYMFLASDFGIGQVWYKKVLLAMIVCGLGKFYSIDRLQLYMPPLPLFLEQRTFSLIRIVMECFDLPRSIPNVQR